MQGKIKAGIEKGVEQQKAQLKKQEVDLRKTNNKVAQLQKSLDLSTGRFQRADEEIKKLNEQNSKGITPQTEGLLEENILIEKLEELFPKDKFNHPGKGGGIIQYVIEHDQEIGKSFTNVKK